MRQCLLACDMEGLAGVDGWKDCTPGSKAWHKVGRPALAAQARAAVEGLLAGFDAVVVVDGHWRMNNLDAEAFDGLPVRLIQGNIMELTMIPYIGLMDGLALLGAHAGPDTPGHSMAHAVSGQIRQLEVGGWIVGEAGLNILAAAGQGVPTIGVHGDLVACREAGAILNDPGVAMVEAATIYRGRRKALDVEPVCEALREEFGAAALACKEGSWRPVFPAMEGPPRIRATLGYDTLDIEADSLFQAYGWLLDDLRHVPRRRFGIESDMQDCEEGDCASPAVLPA